MTPAHAPAMYGSPRRRPIGWLCAVLCVLGAALIAYEFAAVVRVFPGSALLAFLLLLFTVSVGVAALRRARPIRSPWRVWVWSGVVWGGTAATGCAIVANTGLNAIWSKTAGIEFASRWAAALTAPLNEELLKLSGVALIALLARQLVRGPLDGFFLGAFTGLGFQVVENWTFALNSLLTGGGVDEADNVAQSFATRVVFTGLGSHWAMSAVAGTAVGILLAHHGRPVRGRILPATCCVMTAMAMHWFFDAPLVGSVAGVGIKTAVNFLVAAGFYLALRRGVRGRARDFVESPGSPWSAELLSRRSRHRALLRVPPAQRPAVRAYAEDHLDTIEEHAANRS